MMNSILQGKNIMLQKEKNMRDLTRKEIQFLEEKKATPSEMRVYKIISNLYEEEDEPVLNGQIKKVYGGHRTNIQHYLKSMKEKKIIKKATYRSYVPLF